MRPRMVALLCALAVVSSTEPCAWVADDRDARTTPRLDALLSDLQRTASALESECSVTNVTHLRVLVEPLARSRGVEHVTLVRNHPAGLPPHVIVLYSRPAGNDSSARDGLWKEQSGWLDQFAAEILRSRGTAGVSRPFLDCPPPRRLVALSRFFACSIGESSISGAVSASVTLASLHVDECGSAGIPHDCDNTTTHCVLEGSLARCRCLPGFHPPPGSRDEDVANLTGFPFSSCLPCPPGCPDCGRSRSCPVRLNVVLRVSILGVQISFLTVALILVGVVVRFRRAKVFASAMWTMLAMILLGASILYASVVVHYFEASTVMCLLGPWLREVGFAVCYGAVILKIYKILVEFRRRKAHRWIIRNRDLLKYLAIVLVLTIGYMIGWTATALERLWSGQSLLQEGRTAGGDRFVFCRSTASDYVREIVEILAVCYGMWVCSHIRRAETDFNDRAFLCASVYLEAGVSTIYYLLAHVLVPFLHPDVLFLLQFARCHLSTTVVVGLIFGSKCWYVIRPPQNSFPPNDQEARLQDAFDLEGKELDISEMDLDDIKAELKRLYTQLQIMHNKTLRQDNPHISKRRGGRKPTHRRFSLQVKHRRSRGGNGSRAGGHGHGAEDPADGGSRTPENSVCSNDGDTAVYPDGPSTISVDMGMAARGRRK